MQQQVRSAKGSAQSEDFTVHVAPGKYLLTKTWALGPEDGGDGGFKIVWQGIADDSLDLFAPAASGAAVPIISGAARVDSWKQYNASSNVWSANLAVPTRQLFVNGVRAQRPSRLATDPEALGKVTSITETGFLVSSEAPLQWSRPDLVEFLFTGSGTTWTEPRCRVLAVGPRTDGQPGSNVTMQQACFSTGRNRDHGKQAIKDPIHVENVLEWVTSGGVPLPGNSSTGLFVYDVEWTDPDHPSEGGKGTIYYRPNAGGPTPDQAVAEVPALQGLLRVEGDVAAGGAVAGLELRGLVFEQGGWVEPSGTQGYIDNQSGWYYGRNGQENTPAQVSISGGRGIVVEGCVFRRMGSSALWVTNSSQGVTVRNNWFTDLSGGAVTVGTVNDNGEKNETLQNAGFVVEQNYVSAVPLEYHSCAGILAGYVRDTAIQDNDVGDTSNTGISVGWGWGASNYMRNNTIQRNKVHGSNWRMADGGAIYTLSAQPGSFMRWNYVYNQGEAPYM